MSVYLGIDTSNYTTSLAIYNKELNKIKHIKKLLPVKKGQRGLRQSAAVFHHNVALPILSKQLFENTSFDKPISAVGVSSTPRSVEGSYMPCFVSGISVAKTLSCINKIKCYEFSHQQGHIVAALYSANKLDLLKKEFIAFHLSGGTTEVVMVKPDKDNIISTDIICQSSDLKAGQAIDRIGVMLGLDFPAGMELDKLANKSNKKYKIKPSLNGLNCSLSGVENKCKEMFEKGDSNEDISRYCIEYIYSNLDAMTSKIVEKYKNLELVFSGGVMSNSIIRRRFEQKYNCSFATPEFSSDNAAGIAILTSIKDEML